MKLEFHRGRLFDHVHLRVKDLDASVRFYRAVLASLGRELHEIAPGAFASDELFITAADGASSNIHLAFQTNGRDDVDRFYQAAIAAGGRDNGKPGERFYHPGYYGAFVLDPDGCNIEAVYHGPAERSVPSVVLTAEVPAPAKKP
ncbi:VOC family protein [Pendulispora albinea]|uniref:VOC family protein n=1 Tax=Pendulispora albinea TaxID=2741071 RepID=A0ABZ2M6Z9_9BACT